MVTITLLCPYCESDDLVRNGHASNGKQRYFCMNISYNSHKSVTFLLFTLTKHSQCLLTWHCSFSSADTERWEASERRSLEGTSPS